MRPTQRRLRRGLRVEAEDLRYVALGQKTGKTDCDQVGAGFECHIEEYKLLPAETRDPCRVFNPIKWSLSIIWKFIQNWHETEILNCFSWVHGGKMTSCSYQARSNTYTAWSLQSPFTTGMYSVSRK